MDRREESNEGMQPERRYRLVFAATLPQEAICPACAEKQPRIHDHGGCSPAQGDFTICYHCGTVLRFSSQPPLRPATLQEVVQALARGEVAPGDAELMLAAIEVWWARKPKGPPGSNRRGPSRTGGHGWDRTSDPLRVKQVLYH